MEMRMSSLPARVAVALVLAAASLSASAAMIVPTGGTALVVPGVEPGTQTIAGQYGSFFAGNYVNVPDWHGGMPIDYPVGTATVYGNVTPEALRLNVGAHTVISDQTYVGRARGSIGFDLTDDTALSFSFLQSQGAFDNVFADAAVTIRDAQGNIVFGCTGGSPAYDFTFGGCAVGSQPAPTPNEDLLPNDGFMQLLAGHYDISFEADASIFTGVGVSSDFRLNLSVVPLPAALPLLLSGLGVLGTFRRRSTHRALRESR